MSHFVVLVLVPKPDKDEDEAEALRESVKKALAPFDENQAVPEYEEPCWCIGSVAREEVREAVAKEFGDWETLRRTFREKDIKGEEEVVEAAWREFIAPLTAFQKNAMEKHPKKDHPAEDCEDCSGTGTRKTTYNPKSKWDWWTIGGRWNGYFDKNYDPEADPANMEVCRICGGSGKRDDDLGRQARAEDPAYTCNGCSGRGKTLKWPSHLKPHANWMDTAKLIAGSIAPSYALLTPDGEWHQRGEMGWFGISHDEKERDTWENEYRKCLRAFPDTVAVAVDCHI